MFVNAMIRAVTALLFVTMLASPVLAADATPNNPADAASSNGSGDDTQSLFTVDKGSAISGRIQAVSHADVSSVMAARIKQIPVHEGDGFRKGQLLVEFDCAVEYAELSKAEADYKAAKEKADVSKELVELNSISKLEMVTAKSEAAKALAEQDIWQEKVRRCKVYAPFDGHVADIYMQPFEFARPGDKLMKILDDTRFQVEALIPSNWLTSITLGMPFSLVIDETGATYKAKVRSIGAEIDSVSQTVKLIGDIEGDNRGLIAGMSGRLIMPFASNGAAQSVH